MSSSAQNGPTGVTSDTAHSPNQEAKPTQLNVPKIIGIYGIPGSGKTTLLNELRHNLNVGCFSFYEGSEVIADVTPGGLAAFQKLDEQSKKRSRQLAIKGVYDDCAKSGKTAIVTGHYMF
jgi:broad-specificity NMP kinase